MRNTFENNEPYATHAELAEMSDGPYIVLPPLHPDYEYQLVQMDNGVLGVIVKLKG